MRIWKDIGVHVQENGAHSDCSLSILRLAPNFVFITKTHTNGKLQTAYSISRRPYDTGKRVDNSDSETKCFLDECALQRLINNV